MAVPIIILTDDQLKIVGRAAGIGCNFNEIAHLIDVAPATFDRLVERDPRVKEAVEKGKACSGFEVMNTAYDMAVSGQVPAMTMFWLKTQKRWTETKPQEDEKPANPEQFSFQMNYAKAIK